MSKCLIANISKEIMNSFNYSYSYLREEDLQSEMKDLILESNLIESKFPISFSFVYMFDFKEEQMREISNFFKERNIYAIFCGSTKTNLLWTLKDLIDEIIKEHMTFMAMNTLQDLIKKLMKLPINENKDKIENALMRSFIVLQEKDLDKMNEMILELTQIISCNVKDA